MSKQESHKLEIVTFNVDRNKEDWLNNIDENKITWSSMNDNDGKYSDAFTKYRVFATPTYYLFDEKGILIEKWHGFDDKMTEQIRTLINKEAI